jgi:hypothetical protein
MFWLVTMANCGGCVRLGLSDYLRNKLVERLEEEERKIKAGNP